MYCNCGSTAGCRNCNPILFGTVYQTGPYQNKHTCIKYGESGYGLCWECINIDNNSISLYEELQKELQKEIEYLRKEVKALREELKKSR
jgi:hypothetical protein